MKTLRPWLRRLRWGWLLWGTLAYLLGVGMARYLGAWLHPGRLWAGWLALTLLQAGAALAGEALDLPLAALPGDADPPPVRLRVSAAAGLWLAAALAWLALAWGDAPSLGLLLLLVAWLLLAALLWRPLAQSGTGEIGLAFFLGGLAPALGFVLQQGSLHRLLNWLALPLTLLALASFLVWEFPTYAQDRRRGRLNLLQRLDWRLALWVHHGALLGGALALLLALGMGLPWRIGGPALLAWLPAGAQVWLLQRMAQGARPLWRELRLLAWLTPLLACYLLAVGFWTS